MPHIYQAVGNGVFAVDTEHVRPRLDAHAYPGDARARELA